jgi:hypothetical protein
MAEEADLIRVTSQEWCDQFAKQLLITKKYEPSYYEDVPYGDHTTRIYALGGMEAAYGAAKKYVDKEQPVPASIVRAILEEHKPKKGGRHSRLEQWAADKANAYSCYFAMERLFSVEPGMSQTAAATRIGKLRGRAPAAVVRCWKHFRDSE